MTNLIFIIVFKVAHLTSRMTLMFILWNQWSRRCSTPLYLHH